MCLCACPRGGACVCACVWMGVGVVTHSRSTIALFGGPHCRPCAVDYHTAVRTRSRQKQHDSPTLPDSTTPHAHDPLLTQAQGGMPVRWAHNGPPSRTSPLFLSPHTRQSNYTVGCKERQATRYSSLLPTDDLSSLLHHVQLWYSLTHLV